MDKILAPIMWAVSWLMYGIHEAFVAIGMKQGAGPAWVLAIIGLTLVVRILILPLYNKQIKATRATQILQPELQKINKKYQGRRDQLSIQRKQEETQAIYRKHGISPLASCFPMLIQMPILLSLYRVLYAFPAIANGTRPALGPINKEVAQSFESTTIFGVPLPATFSGADSFPGYSNLNIRIVAVVLVGLMIITQFLTMRQMMTMNMPERSGDDANPAAAMQKTMMYGMPLIYVFTGAVFPIGVLVYWCAGNLWTLGQQTWFIRHNPTPGSRAHREREERLRKKRARQGLSEEEIAELEAKEQAGGQRYQPMSAERARKAGVTKEEQFGDNSEDKPVVGKDGLTDEERARKRYERRRAERERSKKKRKKKRNN